MIKKYLKANVINPSAVLNKPTQRLASNSVLATQGFLASRILELRSPTKVASVAPSASKLPLKGLVNAAPQHSSPHGAGLLASKLPLKQHSSPIKQSPLEKTRPKPKDEENITNYFV